MINKFLYIFKKIVFFSYEIQGKAKVSIWSTGIRNIMFEGKNLVPEFCVASGKIKIGYCTTLGVHNFIFGDVNIGKYCQLGAYVAIHGSNHPLSFPTTYINKNLLGGDLIKLKVTNEINIGNDVWIGHNAIILSGVSIGNGAVIAAGSVVTKNVPPYSIVGGNPCRLIRKRFSDKIINELQELRWWDKDEDFIKKNETFFKTDLNTIDSLEKVIIH